MKKILIATKNLDKYNITNQLIERVAPRKFTFSNLIDLGIEHEIEENGSIKERAEQKALVYFNYLKDNNLLNDIFAVVGIDDGFDLSESGQGDPNSKEITDAILSGEYLKENERIWMKRAFAIYNSEAGMNSCLTSVPFVFLGNKNNITREDGKYPLRNVLGSVDLNKTMIDMTHDEAMDYYFKHSERDLKIIF